MDKQSLSMLAQVFYKSQIVALLSISNPDFILVFYQISSCYTVANTKSAVSFIVTVGAGLKPVVPTQYDKIFGLQ
jgi:hypothetical protein